MKRQLEKNIEMFGFKYQQIMRDGDVAIYEQTGDGVTSYEVIVVQQKKAETKFGIDYPDRELYPSSDHWGVQGWTYTNRDAALDKASQLTDSDVS